MLISDRFDSRCRGFFEGFERQFIEGTHVAPGELIESLHRSGIQGAFPGTGQVQAVIDVLVGLLTGKQPKLAAMDKARCGYSV